MLCVALIFIPFNKSIFSLHNIHTVYYNLFGYNITFIPTHLILYYNCVKGDDIYVQRIQKS